MNPLIEQHDYNFLKFTKNKCNLEVQKDTTVSLLVDEIHLKPYFDYKDTNIVGLSDNSNDAAFTFTLSSVFSQYKNVVHVMPINFFEIVKHITIGSEEMGFQVLSIITDNNATNKKLYLSFDPRITSFNVQSASLFV